MKNSVVILGDWAVDEYWFVTRYQSETSSHAGPHHFEVTSNPEAQVRDLSGAGHVARLLNQQRLGEPTASLDLVGLGHWDESDTELLRRFFDDDSPVVEAGFRLELVPERDKVVGNLTGIRLVLLSKGRCTTRVVRCYDRSRSGWRLLNRVDWETGAGSEGERENDWVNELPSEAPVAIVLYDIGKGAVTDDTVAKLKSKYAGAKCDWYVLTKSLLAGLLAKRVPSWWEKIAADTKLLLLGREVLADFCPLDNWSAGKGHLSRRCFELLSLPDLDHPRTLLLLTNSGEAVARVGDSGERSIFFWDVSLPDQYPYVRVGWQSSVFGHLVAGMLGNERVQGDDVSKALEMGTSDSCKVASMRTESKLKSDHLVSPRTTLDWSKEQSAWESATKIVDLGQPKVRPEPELERVMAAMGIAKRGKDWVLEVWRGSTDLPGYIACVEGKREQIRRIADVIDGYKKGGRSKSVGILLIADPGSGKTALARRLAETFNFSFDSCDLTQMASRNDLIEFFDKISTRQATDSHDNLVFVDEVNARVGGEHLFSAFLAPIEDGIYFRGLRKVSLRPAIWVFAMPPSKAAIADQPGHIEGAGNKFIDFRSRIALEVNLDYRSLQKNETGRRTLNGVDTAKRDSSLKLLAQREQVYIAATKIRAYRQDILSVSPDLLWLFYGLDPETNPARTITRCVSLLSNVRHGQVSRRNLSATCRRELERNAQKIPRNLPDFVRLEFLKTQAEIQAASQ